MDDLINFLGRRASSPTSPPSDGFSPECWTTRPSTCPAAKAQSLSREEWYVVVTARDVIKLLAMPYADHPDYRVEWRP